MSVPGTQETKAQPGITLESPLDHFSGLPSPRPAIRPPDAPRAERATAAAVAEKPLLRTVQVEPARPEAPVTAITPAGEELPTMAPQEKAIDADPAAAAPSVDHFAGHPAVELEPVQPAQIDSPELPLIAPPESQAAAGVRVVIRLQGDDRVDVGEFEDRGAAMEGAREVVEQLTHDTGNTWPFYGNRFIRPGAIVSVDLVEND